MKVTFDVRKMTFVHGGVIDMKWCWENSLRFACGMLLSVGAYADTLHALENIEQVVYEYALQNAQERFDNPQIVMGKLDTRLRLHACDSRLNVFSNIVNTGLGNQTVGVKCNSPVAWTVYVPFKVKVLEPVVVSVKPLAANQIITAADIKLQEWDLGNLRQGYVKNTSQIVGKQLKYPIAMGTVIKPHSVKDQKLVHRGEEIILLASAGKMEVKMSGTALSDASLGQRVRVKNSSSKRVVEGVVQAAGIVKVAM